MACNEDVVLLFVGRKSLSAVCVCFIMTSDCYYEKVTDPSLGYDSTQSTDDH